MLRNDRKNRAQNQIPILAQGDGNDGLNVERKLVAIVRRPVAEVFVRLKRHADQRRNRIRQLLRQLVRFIAAGFCPRDFSHRHPVRVDVRWLRGGQFVNRQKESSEDCAYAAGNFHELLRCDVSC